MICDALIQKDAHEAGEITAFSQTGDFASTSVATMDALCGVARAVEVATAWPSRRYELEAQNKEALALQGRASVFMCVEPKTHIS